MPELITNHWQNSHPTEEGYYWYWHPDFVDPFPIHVVKVRTDTEYRWEYEPDRYTCSDDEEWWKGPFAPPGGVFPPNFGPND